jgi:hypothetical protein
MSFKSFLDAVGHDVKKGLLHILPYALPIAEAAAEVAIASFAPELGPLFNQVMAAVVTAEQSAHAAGKSKNGPEKLANVIQLMGPLIKSGLADIGKAADDPAVERYVNAVVTILNGVATTDE